MAQRLFQHHAGALGGQARRAQLLAGRGEQRRCRGQVHHDGVGIARLQQLAQRSIVGRLGQVHAQVVQVLGKAGKFCITGPLVGFDLGQPLGDQRAIFVVAHRATAYADDAPVGRQAAMAERLKQRGQQFAPGQIAGAAK